MRTVHDVLDSYVLCRELHPSTVELYRRHVRILSSWYGATIPADDFGVDLCNRFLAAKQDSGVSWPYRKGLRATLKLLLNHAGKAGKLRTVKSQPFEPEVWTPEEVAKLIDAAPNDYWRTIIEGAYASGLAQVDLELIERQNIESDGMLRWRRHKTGVLVVVQFPLSLVEKLPASGKCWPRPYTREYFRRVFGSIVKKAGVRPGPFKKLRKTSGTSVEEQFPGCGHIHLGNSRRVFEQHYLGRREAKPFSPKSLPTDRSRPPGA